MKKTYLIVGNWSFDLAPMGVTRNPPPDTGITTYEYDPETGALTLIGTYEKRMAAGQLCLDEERQIIYAVNERGERWNSIGGGGYIFSMKLDPHTGALSLLNEQETLCPEPSFISMDAAKRHLLVCHCSDPFHVTKIFRKDDGSFGNKVLHDDSGIALFNIEEDGTISPVRDFYITESSGGTDPDSVRNIDPVTNHVQMVRVMSRMHCVMPAPQKNFYVACDKGMDRMYSFRVDEDHDKLRCLWQLDLRCGSFPRYADFHPTLPVLYSNSENASILNVIGYDYITGRLEQREVVQLLEKEVGLIEGKPVGAQDIKIHPSGRFLYVTLSGLNDIVAFRIDEEGVPHRIQQISSGGNLPRGLCFSPELRYLYCGNLRSQNITAFQIGEDGTLTRLPAVTEACTPSALKMLTVEI